MTTTNTQGAAYAALPEPCTDTYGNVLVSIGDEVENAVVRFFVGAINPSQQLCSIDQSRPWSLKDETHPMAACIRQGNYAASAVTLTRAPHGKAPTKQPAPSPVPAEVDSGDVNFGYCQTCGRSNTIDHPHCKPSPTAQADTQPAPAQDYPSLPDFDTVEQHIYGACRRYITQDMLEPIHNLIRDAIDADRAARAPADSVLAARVPDAPLPEPHFGEGRHLGLAFRSDAYSVAQVQALFASHGQAPAAPKGDIDE